MKEIQIPSGMRDILPGNSINKRHLQQKVEQIFHLYGYLPIETPLLEFYETYRSSFSRLEEDTLYKFVDENGQILVLRTDMTLPIARVCATRYSQEKPPFRFSYCSNVYKVRQSFAGKRNEVTDCGIELIGLDESSDLEVLNCALEVMAELSEDHYVLEIGNIRLFRRACEIAGIQEESAAVLSDLIDRKAMTEVKQMVDALNLREQEKEFFRRLPLFNGSDSLSEAAEYCFTEELLVEIEHLQRLQEQLCVLGNGEHITFDLGKVPHLEYYTGIIFEGYAQGISSAVLSGGRYDHLLAKLGRDLPAIGFGVKLDVLVPVVKDTLPEIQKVYYRRGEELQGILKARELRKRGPVTLIPEDTEADV